MSGYAVAPRGVLAFAFNRQKSWGKPFVFLSLPFSQACKFTAPLHTHCMLFLKGETSCAHLATQKSMQTARATAKYKQEVLFSQFEFIFSPFPIAHSLSALFWQNHSKRIWHPLPPPPRWPHAIAGLSIAFVRQLMGRDYWQFSQPASPSISTICSTPMLVYSRFFASAKKSNVPTFVFNPKI